MFKRISIFLIVLSLLLAFTIGVGATAAGLFVEKDAGNTYINYVNADGTSIMKIDDTDGVTIAVYTADNTYTSMTITTSTDASSLTVGSIVTPGGIACAKQLFLGDDINMSVSGTGVYDITLRDTVNDALSIVGGSTDMMVFDTDTDAILIVPPLTVTGVITSNGGITVGASGAGFDVTFYGDEATADFFWDQNGDTYGSLTLGADTKGVDFKAFGTTTGNYVIWDRSADDLLLVGTATQLGVAGTTASTSSTTGSIHTAGGLGVAGAAFIAGVVEVGADAAGTDFTVYGDVTAYKTWWDANGDTNGAWYFGADTKGVLVSLYGDTTGCGVFWNPSTDTNGTLSIGATGGAKGVDVVMYGHTNGSYLKWDRSADALLVVASTITFSGAITTGITMPGDVDYTPIQIGTKASSATGGFNVASTTADDSGGVQIYGDDAGASLTYPVEVLTPLRVRYLLSVDQTGGVSHTALFAQMVSNGTRSYTTGCVRAVYAFLQLGAVTLVTSGEVVGINQATTLVGNMVVGTGCTFAGIDINIATGVYTIDSGGTNAALLIRSSGTGLWRNGIEIAASGATTGIKIAACTTGIALSGIQQSAITIITTGSTATTGHCIAIGVAATPITTATSAAAAVRCYSDYSKADGYHFGAQFVSRYTATGYGSVRALVGQVDSTGTQTTATTAQYLVGIHGRATVTGTVDNTALFVTGVMAQMLDGGTWTHADHVSALWVDWQLNNDISAVSSSELAYLSNNANSETGNPTNVFYVYAPRVTNFITFSGVYTTAGGMCAASTTAGTMSYTVRCIVNGTTAYLHLYNQ